MRKVFIDCGAWEGISSKFFKEIHPNSDEFEIYAFECNKGILPKLSDELVSKEGNVIIMEFAVWDKDEDINLYVGSGDFTESSSLIKEKRTGNLNKENPNIVNGIDFSRWIKDKFDKDDYIICKMNIEGAEYKVLDKLIKDGTIEYFNKLFIDWHWKKINFPKKEHNRIKNSIPIPIHKWALEHDGKSNVIVNIKEFKKKLLG